jgi:hypothetical protein
MLFCSGWCVNNEVAHLGSSLILCCPPTYGCCCARPCQGESPVNGIRDAGWPHDDDFLIVEEDRDEEDVG